LLPWICFQVLLEFKEYATEVDVDFVRKAVRAIGRCAIKLERAAERCINVLLDLIKIKVNYVVQEAIVVIKDIFRRYPNMYVNRALFVSAILSLPSML
jgi:AP-1 complex subunit beta-1